MPGQIDSTSTTLIESVKRNEPLAWQRLAQLYSPLVYAWCRKLGVSQTDSADVAQEVFRSVHAHVGGFRRDRPGHAFRGWLWTITRNKIRDHFRSSAGRARATGGTDAQMKLLELPDELTSITSSSSAGGSLSTEFMRGLELVQGEFADRTWRAFWRATIDGIPVAQVAVEIGMSANAVRLAKSRILRRLRELLGTPNQ